MATGKAIIPGGLGLPIRSAMKAEIANPPKNAIAAMIRVVIVAPRGSSNDTTRYNKVARNEYAAARNAIAIETWKTDPPIRFVTSPTACAIKSNTNPVPENHMTDSDGMGAPTFDCRFDSTLEYGFGSTQLSSENERQGSAMPEQVTTTQNSPVDRGLSCIPLFGLGRLGAFYVANPLLPLGCQQDDH